MTSEHFKEFLLTVSMTTGVSVRQIAHHVGINYMTMWIYQTHGVPVQISALICKRLKDFCMEFKDKSFEPVFIPSGRKKVIAN